MYYDSSSDYDDSCISSESSFGYSSSAKPNSIHKRTPMCELDYRSTQYDRYTDKDLIDYCHEEDLFNQHQDTGDLIPVLIASNSGRVELFRYCLDQMKNSDDVLMSKIIDSVMYSQRSASRLDMFKLWFLYSDKQKYGQELFEKVCTARNSAKIVQFMLDKRKDGEVEFDINGTTANGETPLKYEPVQRISALRLIWASNSFLPIYCLKDKKLRKPLSHK
ncbi:hypothetical protein ACOME3_006506 [Neoechinorhynchus agilis]